MANESKKDFNAMMNKELKCFLHHQFTMMN